MHMTIHRVGATLLRHGSSSTHRVESGAKPRAGMLGVMTFGEALKGALCLYPGLSRGISEPP